MCIRDRLEIVCRVTPYRGFESHSLRHNWIRIGAVAQLGERQVRNLEVVGSIPICSTISFPDGNIGRARRGDSGALYPQSAIAGLNSCLELTLVSLVLSVVLRIRPCATVSCEPRQVRKEAAVSSAFCVPQVSLV